MVLGGQPAPFGSSSCPVSNNSSHKSGKTLKITIPVKTFGAILTMFWVGACFNGANRPASTIENQNQNLNQNKGVSGANTGRIFFVTNRN